jgi:asparagine synthase (glutamine-hydrolysing)
MCGIFGFVEKCDSDNSDKYDKNVEYNNKILLVQNLLNHRGPDSSGQSYIKTTEPNTNIVMVHTRLHINGNFTPQPLTNKEGTISVIVNGEIFNWKELEMELDYKCKKSDCEIIIPLYQKYKNDIPLFFNKLQGQFSMFLYDKSTDSILVGRDSIGVTPLYYAIDNNKFVVSSELRCISEYQGVSVFLPRHYIYDNVENILTKCNENNLVLSNYFDIDQYYHELNTNTTLINNDQLKQHQTNIKDLLIRSVKSQLEDLLSIDNKADFGVLLSGGLDSSLIASIVVKIAKELNYSKPIKTFSVGINSNVPDLVAARKVANYIGSEHHEYTFTINEGLDALKDVVWYTETYDCTTIRASTPMFLLTKKIHEDFKNLKVLFSGELSDELFCYLYGANAPSLADFQNETVNLVKNVHQFDCLRSNKTCMANSIEVRVPFTDINFVKYVLSMSPEYKFFGNNERMEKQILRDSFVGFLQDEILYRKKEQFSDGVSGFNGKEDNWIDALKHFCELKYTDTEFVDKCSKFLFNNMDIKDNIPDTKEKLYYRELFGNYFVDNGDGSGNEKLIKYWKPNWSKNRDPSGRVQNFWEKN